MARFKIHICHFTRKYKIIVINKSIIYKDLLVNLKENTDTTNELVSNIKNDDDKKEDNPEEDKEDKEENNEEDNKKNENNNEEDKKDIEDDNEIDYEENKITSNNINTLKDKVGDKKGNKNKKKENKIKIENNSKNKIKIYTRQKNNNNKLTTSKKEVNILAKTDKKEKNKNIIPHNIKRVINSKTLDNEQKKEPKKEIRVLKFNKNKPVLQNREIKKVINTQNNSHNNSNNQNNKNKNKKSFSISNTPKNFNEVKKYEQPEIIKLKKTQKTDNNNNEIKRQNKSNDLIKKELNKSINSNNSKRKNKNNNNNISKVKNEIKNNEQNLNSKSNSKIFKNQSPNIKNGDHLKKRNNIKNKREFFSQSNLNQSTNIVSSQNKPNILLENKNIIRNSNKLNNKKYNNNINNNIKNNSNNNIKINSYRQNENRKPSGETKMKNNNSKNHYFERSNGKQKEQTKIIVKSANRNIKSNNKNNFGFKLLSDRSINKAKNQISKTNIDNLRATLDILKPKNLKLTHSDKRNIDKRIIPKVRALKIFGRFMKENGNKDYQIPNGLTEYGFNNKNMNNNMNNNSIFKNIQKQHMKKIKNKHYNIISLDKYKTKDNNINFDKFNGMKKINILNINKIKPNIFFKKSSSNELETRYNEHKNRKSNDIFIYTKHYGDHNKCPLCQSMEMKARYSENKLGLYKRYVKPEIEDTKGNTNNSIIKTNFFPIIKGIDDKKDFKDFTIKRNLSPINMNINQENNYFQNSKEQFAFNILRNKGKVEKLGINDFPVLDNYFNS